MIQLSMTMDKHSRAIKRKEYPSEEWKHVGYLRWHSGRTPRIVLDGDATDGYCYLTMDEVDHIVTEWTEIKRKFRGEA